MFDESHDWAGAPAAKTLRTTAAIDGIGLHTGRPVALTIRPAPAGTGILFRRRDLLLNHDPLAQTTGLERVSIAATPAAVSATTLGTVLSNRHNVTVSTVEHLMAAFAGCGVDNAIVEVDGPEIPIMDGSSAPFITLLHNVGFRSLQSPKRALRLMKPVRVEKGDAFVEAVPLDAGEAQTMNLTVKVDFDDPAIGCQEISVPAAVEQFSRAFGAARTFCQLRDVEAMRAKGLALGGSFDNAIVVSEGAVLNEGGLRMDAEFVRHKALDLIGDFYLLGAPLLAHVRAYKPGHDLNTTFAAKLIEEAAATTVPAPTPGEVGCRVQA